jgi:E3 ubiquitin-protein ligase UBR1
MCARCFHASAHDDHNVSFFVAQQSGGSCDCGDPEAWRVPVACPFHPPAPADAPARPAELAPGALPPAVADYPFRYATPPDLDAALRRTIGIALDFVLDTLDHSPDDAGVPAHEADVRAQPTALDAQSHGEAWALVLWNDDKHSFDEVARLVADATGADGMAFAAQVDELGRAVVQTGGDLRALLALAGPFVQVELGVSVRRAHDTCREGMAAAIVDWLLDLTRARVHADALVLREALAAELLRPRARTLAPAYLDQLRAHSKCTPDAAGAPRLDWLFMYHTKLWKRPRLALKELYAAVLALSPAHKLAVAVRFAHAYPRVIDAYLLVDRDAETSIKYFALQLFTVPSVALHVVREHALVRRLLGIIAAFFTAQIRDGRIVPQAGIPAGHVNVDGTPFKSKRFMPVFNDLRYLCHNAPVQRLIAGSPAALDEFARCAALFMCVNANKRAATDHVEYETDAWISVFNVTLSLSRVIKVYGEAFAHARPAQLVAALTAVVGHTLQVCTLATDVLDRAKFAPVAFHTVQFAGRAWDVVDFDVSTGWVSFHHSLHWLLAELVKHTDLLAEDRLAEVGLRTLRDVFMRNANERALQTLFDFPLRGACARARAGCMRC